MSSPTFDSLKVGQSLPDRTHKPTNVSLFLYNAAVWNAHRIHYDERYTTEAEGHPGIVIDGPLMGDWLSQVALNWLEEGGQLVSFGYSNRIAAYLGETLVSGGTVTGLNPDDRSVELSLHIRNEAGQVIAPGTARVVLDG